MPSVSSEITVGTAVTTISGPTIQRRYVYVQNSDYDGSTEIYIGDATVETTTGVRVFRDGNAVFELNADDVLCAVGDGAGAKVRVLIVT